MIQRSDCNTNKPLDCDIPQEPLTTSPDMLVARGLLWCNFNCDPKGDRVKSRSVLICPSVQSQKLSNSSYIGVSTVRAVYASYSAQVKPLLTARKMHHKDDDCFPMNLLAPLCYDRVYRLSLRRSNCDRRPDCATFVMRFEAQDEAGSDHTILCGPSEEDEMPVSKLFCL
jgi:hypothetical protein